MFVPRLKYFLRAVQGVAALGLVLMSGQASAALYAIGPDSSFVPRSFDAVGGSGATSQFALADGSLGFNGGLTYRSADARFYAVANDSSGASSLASFSLAGGSSSYASVAPLGTGFLGGLAYDKADGNFYALSLDFLGKSALNRISSDGSTVTPLGTLGFGFLGGLTYNSDDGKLYAVSADAFGVQSKLNAITIATLAISTTDLGDGSQSFSGGLAYDDVADLFYAIANDGFGNSVLDSFNAAGSAAPTTVGGLGQGYVNSGLAWVPDESKVPEPGTALLSMAALLSLALTRRKIRNRG